MAERYNNWPTKSAQIGIDITNKTGVEFLPTTGGIGITSEPTMEQALIEVARQDVEGLVEAEKEYGDSWKKRGGPGAYFTLARPLDRLERMVSKPTTKGIPYDIFQHILDSPSGDAWVLNAVRDLRRYLLLVEAELVRQGHHLPAQRHNISKQL